ncbi:TPA: hypothetical protein ACNP4C_001617 [Klebsiella oxytoca]|uniref:hypothetical protein n=1 Tax=Klebsiella oxytoca TaxID=571 RepID=UPI000650AD9C|nr:hypothetical protein [Klebsiella oxytoca]KLY14836.1 hypothetical protein SK88_02156 [Klebsiella oxytoca]
MTITLQAVNELIQSLESAGELSIKETKVMALAKAYQQLAAENVVRQEFVKICFRAAADGASLDGADIQEIGERLGLFGRETYQPVLHGYIFGHEAGEDSVYVMKGAPATDAYLAGITADGVTAALESCSDYLDTDCVMDRLDISYEDAEKRTSGAIEFHDAMVNFANQLREGADK